MQPDLPQQKSLMQVPNWLIALELVFGAVLLYVSSSALVQTDMHFSSVNSAKEVSADAPAKLDKDEKIIISATTSSPTAN